MVLIETDIILALSSRKDRHHSEAKEILERLSHAVLSPYTLAEIDLLVSSGTLKVKPVPYYNSLYRALSYYKVTVLPLDPRRFSTAWKLREKYNLTFFDSLHASSAIVSGEVLVSYDKSYSNVEELDYIHPRDLLTKL